MLVLARGVWFHINVLRLLPVRLFGRLCSSVFARSFLPRPRYSPPDILSQQTPSSTASLPPVRSLHRSDGGSFLTLFNCNDLGSYAGTSDASGLYRPRAQWSSRHRSTRPCRAPPPTHPLEKRMRVPLWHWGQISEEKLSNLLKSSMWRQRDRTDVVSLRSLRICLPKLRSGESCTVWSEDVVHTCAPSLFKIFFPLQITSCVFFFCGSVIGTVHIPLSSHDSASFVALHPS